MSFLDKIFGGSDAEKDSVKFWNSIESESDLEEAVKKSFEKAGSCWYLVNSRIQYKIRSVDLSAKV